MYLGIYVGALLSIFFWQMTLRRMIAVKETFRITSIADLISTRYRRSQRIAALVTLIAFLGLLPYISLQLEAVVRSFRLITIEEGRWYPLELFRVADHPDDGGVYHFIRKYDAWTPPNGTRE